MIQNYLKIALRNLRRNPGYSGLNIAGLALGLASAILILLYVQDELSYDRYHENADRIYRLVDTGFADADYAGLAKVNGPWGPAFQEAVPEVEAVTRFVFFGQALMRAGETNAYQSGGFFADSTVFDVFDFKLLAGNPQTVLSQPRSIVVTEELARIYFGDTDPLGQTLEIDTSDSNTLNGPYTVTGILDDIPDQSHFTFRYLVSMNSYVHPEMTSWVVWNQFYTYTLLREGADPASATAKFEEVLTQNVDTEQRDRFTAGLQPLTEIYLHSTMFREIGALGDAKYIYIFTGIALFLLLIASINFINLATARAARRAKEVGVRKVAGAHRTALIKQFLGESFVLTSLAIIVALLLVSLAFGPFNELTLKSFAWETLTSPSIMAGLIGLWLFVSLVAGSYPALVLSRFKPAHAIKGSVRGSGNSLLRKSLVVFQFAISAFLIVATGVVLQQVGYMQQKKLGFNQEQIVNIPIRNDALRTNSSTVKSTLMQHSGVVNVALSGNLPGGGDWGIPIRPEGILEDDIPDTRMLVVDADFVETYQMELIAGSGFSEDRPVELATGYLMNEEAAKQLGWDDPLGKTIAMPAIEREAGPVVGVLENFHFRSMREQISPIILFSPPESWLSIYSVRVRPERIDETLAFLEDTWREFDPEHPFTYSFLDEQFGRLHQAEARAGQLLTFFALLAIGIACLGLFGLAVFTAAQRTKEIGVRKVLGASIAQIVVTLTQDFTRLVALGFILAVPVAYFAASRWLEVFAYRVDISVWMFAGAGLLVLAVAVLTVSFQAIRSALSNPAEALRYE